jgi:ABC-type multidrug transport system fused ATPase/permease subunit
MKLKRFDIRRRKSSIMYCKNFLKNPSILLLDEPTSSLDKNSELEVEKSLEQLSYNSTTVSVSHRLNTIVNCDRICNGKWKIS